MDNREIDKLIAVNILGCSETPGIWFKDYDKGKIYYYVGGSPASEEVSLIDYIDDEWVQYYFSPSTYVEDAWKVVEKLFITTTPQKGAPKELSFHAEIDNQPIGNYYESFAETAPMAICKVALKSVGIDIRN